MKCEKVPEGGSLIRIFNVLGVPRGRGEGDLGWKKGKTLGWPRAALPKPAVRAQGLELLPMLKMRGVTSWECGLCQEDTLLDCTC